MNAFMGAEAIRREIAIIEAAIYCERTPRIIEPDHTLLCETARLANLDPGHCQLISRRDVQIGVTSACSARTNIFRLGVFARSANEALIHALIGFFPAIVKSAKSLIERNKRKPVIAFEVFVMKVVITVVGRDRWRLSKDDAVKPRMPDTGRQRSVYALKYDNERMGRNDEVNQDTRIEKDLLDRV